MLTVSRNNGAKSTTGDKVSKGSKGRLELFATRNEDGSFGVSFADYGNYGKLRYSADFGPLNREDVQNMVSDLQSLLNGDFETTHVTFDQVQSYDNEPSENPELEAVEAVEAVEVTNNNVDNSSRKTV